MSQHKFQALKGSGGQPRKKCLSCKKTSALIIAFVIVVILGAIIGVVLRKNGDPLTITLPNGQIRGHEMKSPNDKVFYAFQGIPYAQPPVGNLRFQAPKPAENWDGVLDATKDGASCHARPMGPIGLGFFDTNENEDCLFVNVYTPKLRSNDSEPLPVMFWIYGGAFASGSSEYGMYGPDYFIEEDIIFVSINYRIGPFGFLSTQDTVIPGNAGLKDQNLALKWTNQNIHLFGGDPEKITIFGESAGSMSVTYHLLSPLSKGLFRGAISDSGSAVNYCSVNHEQMNYTLFLLEQVANIQNLTIDTKTLTSENIRDILLEQSADIIAEAASKEPTGELTKPTIEVAHPGAFLTESPYVLLENGYFNEVPILMGFNSEEGLMFMGSTEQLKGTAKGFDEKPSTLLPVDLFLKENTNVDEVTDLIKDIYLETNQTFQDNLGAAVQWISENMMTRPITKHAELHSKFRDVFFYQFSYHGVLGGNRSYDDITGTLLGNVAHAEELSYMFKMDSLIGNTTDMSIYPKQDVIVHDRMIKMWTNFVKTLHPTPEQSELLQNISWPTLKQPGFQYLDIDTDLTVVHAYPRKDHYEKWSTIFYTYGIQPFFNF